MYIATPANIDELKKIAAELLAEFPKEKIFLFYAKMGAGKTTLIKELCLCLGVKENMSSPTYPIVNEYSGSFETIYHFDLYRLKNTDECLDIGFEEYIYSGNYCFIEWPDIAGPLLPKKHVVIHISIDGEGRIITAEQRGV